MWKAVPPCLFALALAACSTAAGQHQLSFADRCRSYGLADGSAEFSRCMDQQQEKHAELLGQVRDMSINLRSTGDRL